MRAADSHHESKAKFLDAALYVIRAKGYSATRIDDVCEAAGLTKGSFFHHFKSKEDLALAAIEHFGALADEIFQGPYDSLSDSVQRLLGYVDFRIAMLEGELPETTCLAGTVVQETYETHPRIREACDRCIREHAAGVARIAQDALEDRGLTGTCSAESLALHIQAVLQGAFVLAKAQQDPDVAVESLRHLRRYLELLFAPSAATDTTYSPEMKHSQSR